MAELLEDALYREVNEAAALLECERIEGNLSKAVELAAALRSELERLVAAGSVGEICP